VRIYRYVTEGSFDAYMWQVLETKARFIQQVMSGHTSVRAAEDLEAGALTYAEIKAIASGNPAVMEKVKVDTEVRKLDQLRAAHVNQQHSIRLQLHRLPMEIAEAQRTLAKMMTDVAMRDAHDGEEFAMTVGSREYSGKVAREEAAKALTYAVLSWRDDPTVQLRGVFRGFEILSKGNASPSLTPDGERLPDLFIRSAGTYVAHLNPANPIGTVQSLEHTLRALDRVAAEEQKRVEEMEKTLADYQAQAQRPFEHEARLTELLARQAQVNAILDLDKGERQVAEAAEDRSASVRTDAENFSVSSRNNSKALADGASRTQVVREAAQYMRQKKTAIVDMAITERTAPQVGIVSGTAVAQSDTHLAIATAPNSFVVLETAAADGDIEVGTRVQVRFNRGRGTIEAAGRGHG
jgi:hypothetical protein